MAPIRIVEDYQIIKSDRKSEYSIITYYMIIKEKVQN